MMIPKNPQKNKIKLMIQLTIDFLCEEFTVDHPVGVEPDVAEDEGPLVLFAVVYHRLPHDAETRHHDKQDYYKIRHIHYLETKMSKK